MFRLAHLSDPHLGPLPRPRLAELLGKRVLGLLSWQLRRRRIHDSSVLELLTQDLAAMSPDHIAVTGDLVNISLPGEFLHAASWLRRLGSPEDVSIVPGNHDAYVAMAWENSIGLWSDFMFESRDANGGDAGTAIPESGFPYVRVRDEVALIGISTARPMAATSAGGIAGQRQLRGLAARLDELRTQNLFRVVLIHHPPHDSQRHRRKRLYDSADFRDVLARHGAELVLHGHTHQAALRKLATPEGYAPVISVPSASANADHGYKGHAGYHVYGIERAGKGWRIEVEVRGIVPSLDRFEVEGRFALAVPH
jgi:3',5'-cyclic AMP phosphodiesterase CpdA